MAIKIVSQEALEKIVAKIYLLFQNKSDVGHIHSYTEITDKPLIPSKMSELTNEETKTSPEAYFVQSYPPQRGQSQGVRELITYFRLVCSSLKGSN